MDNDFLISFFVSCLCSVELVICKLGRTPACVYNPMVIPCRWLCLQKHVGLSIEMLLVGA